MLGMELMCFNIISSVGAARSCFIEAIDMAADGKFDDAQKLIEEGQKNFTEGHKAHMELLTKASSGETVEIGMLLIHAEDQLMSAESFGILAERFLTLYKKIK